MLLDTIVMNVKMDTLILYLEKDAKIVIVIQSEVLTHLANVPLDNVIANQVLQGMFNLNYLRRPYM